VPPAVGRGLTPARIRTNTDPGSPRSHLACVAMIKTLFIPASGSDTDHSVFGTAHAIGAACAAHLRFHHIHLSAGTAAPFAPHVDFAVGRGIAAALEELQQSCETLAVNAFAHYRTFCETRQIPMQITPDESRGVTASWSEDTNASVSRLLIHARHSDISVLGRPRNRDFMPSALIETLLTRSGRPIVLAPDSDAPQSIKTVVVGWKETPEAARALTAAMPLLEQASRVVLLSVAEDGAASESALTDLASQLVWHGVSPEVRVCPAGELQTAAAQFHPDLVVVGGFGHGQFRERMFGGVTQSLIYGAPFPVFMMH